MVSQRANLGLKVLFGVGKIIDIRRHGRAFKSDEHIAELAFCLLSFDKEWKRVFCELGMRCLYVAQLNDAGHAGRKREPCNEEKQKSQPRDNAGQGGSSIWQ
ncbi:hypothetical protein ACOTTU_10400 [Roseobacter sp. EG26]|uniref:hypothetical protein n=1 Tax=Roseobacter sp. EG26 TaxID=3412477 RepID=UPI003CE45B83